MAVVDGTERLGTDLFGDETLVLSNKIGDAFVGHVKGDSNFFLDVQIEVFANLAATFFFVGFPRSLCSLREPLLEKRPQNS